MTENLIIIDITDKELTELDVASQIKEVKGSGTLTIKNPSQKSRLWNLNCDTKEIINTTIQSKVIEIGTINPGQDFCQEYDIQNLKEPCLKLLEVFDTERGTGDTINNSFLYQQKNLCQLKLNLTNILDVPILNIKLLRDMPELLQDIEIISPNVGNAELKEGENKKELSWEIESLEAKGKAELVVTCVTAPQEKKEQSLGKLKITYLIENHKLTMMVPEVQGLTASMSGISTDESSTPGSWDCNVEFINDSEFKVKLEKVEVNHNITTGSETVVSETPNVDLDPQNSWEFDFKVDSTNVPKLESKIEFTTLFIVPMKVIGQILKESTIYTVLAAEVEKTIDPPEVGAYANTDIQITNRIVNTGTVGMDFLKIFDDIPKDFIPPTLDKIKLVVKNPEGETPIQDRKEYINKFEIYPNDENPDSTHKIIISLYKLEKLLPPSSELLMSYPLLAKNPKPEVNYNTPIIIKGNTPKKGTYFEISPPEEPVIKIRYIQRKLKTLKSVKPGASEGEFSISVRIQNKGDVELENLIVKDAIPAGFTLSEFNPPQGATHEVITSGETSELVVKIKEIQANQAITLNYNCSGTGNYDRTEPQVVVKGREGAESDNSSGEKQQSVSNSIEGAVTRMDLAKKGNVLMIFKDINKEIEGGINCERLGTLLENIKDELPPGPVLHQLMAYAREIKAKGAQMIIGELRNDIISKIKEFQNKY